MRGEGSPQAYPAEEVEDAFLPLLQAPPTYRPAKTGILQRKLLTVFQLTLSVSWSFNFRCFFSVHRKYAYISTILAITNRFSTMMSWCIFIEPNLHSSKRCHVSSTTSRRGVPRPITAEQGLVRNLFFLEETILKKTAWSLQLQKLQELFDWGSDEFILMWVGRVSAVSVFLFLYSSCCTHL